MSPDEPPRPQSARLSLEARLAAAAATTPLPPVPVLEPLEGPPPQQDEQQIFYRHRAQEFVDLHDQVETSVDLLDSLESFLSTFQRDLSAVSGQISNLQDRSREIESRLKGRRKIERPLSQLISAIAIPPSLAETILDTDVGEPWLDAVSVFEGKLDALRARHRVKAARALSEVAEGLRIVAATKIRSFCLALFQPIRNNMSTNMQVLQTSVLLKYRPLFSFLQRHAAPVAVEVQRAYVGVARVYYETGFRRYARSLGWIKARTTERSDLLAEPAQQQDQYPFARLMHAGLDGPSVTLAYLADDRSYKEPVEALFRSLLLVLMDNGTAEYAFITRFFDPAAPIAPPSPTVSSPSSPAGDDVPPGFPGFSFVGQRAGSSGSIVVGADVPSSLPQSQPPTPLATPPRTNTSKEQQAFLDGIWKQVMEPALEHCQTFTRTALDPAPPVVPLLTMIRLLENVLGEVQKRDCPPLETYAFGLRLSLWPVFQNLMNAHVESVKKLADGAGAGVGFLGGGRSSVKDATVQAIAQRYAVHFTSFVALTDNEEETMIFSNLTRLRAELNRLIVSQSSKVKDQSQAASYQSTMYETVLQALSKGPRPTTHPKAQTEIAYWREREEESRRRIASARR